MTKSQELVWTPRTKLLKYKSHADVQAENPYEVLESEGNIVTTLGIDALWRLLTADGTAPQPFSQANAHIGVGNGTTTTDESDTQLAGNNVWLKAVDNVGGIVISPNSPITVTFKATFDVGEAAFTWNEWGIFNGPQASSPLMLNRKVESNGTKASSDIWIYSVTLGVQQVH